MALELWTILLGLKMAYRQRQTNIELETEWDDALHEWDNWRTFIDVRHSNIVDSLNQRFKLKNLVPRKSVIVRSQNHLARYAAEHGAANRHNLLGYLSHLALWENMVSWYGSRFCGSMFSSGRRGCALEEEEPFLMQEEVESTRSLFIN